MNHTELRAATSLAFVYVLRMLGLFMVMPVLALLALEYADYSPLLLGLAIGGYGLTQAVLQIPMGMLSDRIGRKPVIVAGLVMFAFGSLVAAMADSLMWVVIGRILQGAGAIAGAVMALAGDVSRDSQRPKVMAVIGVSIGFSFYLSLLLGPLLSEDYGLSGIFWATSLLALACIPLVIFVVPKAQNLAPSGDTLPRLKDLGALLMEPKLRKLNFSVLVLHLLITLLFMQFPKLLVAQGWPLDSHWQIYLPVLLLSVLAMAMLMRLSKRLGASKALKLSILLLTLAFAGLALVSNQWLLLLMCWLFFTGFNYLEANLPALVSSLAPAGKKGSAMGAYASFQFFGAFLGGSLAGVIGQYLGNAWLFPAAALLSLIWLFLLGDMAGGAGHLKRYTLAVNPANGPIEQIVQELRRMAGVKDITLVPEELAIYLKVDSRQFNLRQARQVVNSGLPPQA
ncbi:MFS transporter [Aliiglaciecola sp. CAU 1673]|uniref:MFS transporter n=1 Tax=Aliiglaciecola sp. CAU 1673 TaxID=3032595 RepID=UPI0023DA1D34|nr:MFS transporter [Aliiglaciecola sp. CAU 1673]MDF2179149.1 MFS transporter [Aliiglaciecola sp. CAU 1673]